MSDIWIVIENDEPIEIIEMVEKGDPGTGGPGTGGDVAGDTHAATAKETPVDADELPLVDSAAAWALKKITWAAIKAALRTAFDPIYQAAGVTWNTLAGKPSTFPPSTHAHSWSDLTSGVPSTFPNDAVTAASSDHSGSNYGALAKSDGFGSIIFNVVYGRGLRVLGNGEFTAGLIVDTVDGPLSATRTYKAPNADGYVALTASLTGVPDKVISPEVTDATGARTLALTDAGKYIRCTHATATAITVPQESSVAWPAGAVIYLRRVGGAITVAGSGVTITGGNGSTIAQHGTFALRKAVETDTWELI